MMGAGSIPHASPRVLPRLPTLRVTGAPAPAHSLGGLPRLTPGPRSRLPAGPPPLAREHRLRRVTRGLAVRSFCCPRVQMAGTSALTRALARPAVPA